MGLNRAALGICLACIGLLFMIPLSLGNDPSNRTPKGQLFAVGVALTYAV